MSVWRRNNTPSTVLLKTSHKQRNSPLYAFHQLFTFQNDREESPQRFYSWLLTKSFWGRKVSTPKWQAAESGHAISPFINIANNNLHHVINSKYIGMARRRAGLGAINKDKLDKVMTGIKILCQHVRLTTGEVCSQRDGDSRAAVF